MALKDLLTDLSNFKYTNYENAGANNSQTEGRHGGYKGKGQPPHSEEHSKFDDKSGINLSQISGRHGGTEPLGQPPHSEAHSLYDDGVGGLGNPQSFTVRGYTVSDIISGRHGGTVGPTPAQPPHQEEHSKFDNGVGFGVAPSDNPQSFDVRGYTVTGNKRFYIGWQGDIMNHPLSDYGIGPFDTISEVFDHTQTRDKLRNVYSNYPELTFGADIDGGINGLNGSIHIGNQDPDPTIGGGVTYYGSLVSITPRGSIYRAGDGTYRVPQSGHTTNPPGVTTQYPSNIPTFDGTQITHNIPQITLSGPFTDTYQSTLTDGTNGTWENPNVPNAHGSDFMTTPIGESALPTNSVTHIVDMITLSGPTSQNYHRTLNRTPIAAGAHGSDFQTTPIQAYSSIFATQDGLLMNSIYDSGFKRGDMYMNHSPITSTPIFKDFTQSDKSLKPSSEWDPQKYGSNFVDTQYTFFGGEEKEFRFDDRIPYNIPARDNNVIGFDQPFILKDIGDRWGPGKLGAIDEGLFRGGVVTSAARTVADVFRLGKFILTPTGIMFGLKQAGLQLLNPRTETRIWNPLSLGSLAPMVHVDRHLGGGTYEDAIDKDGWESDGFGSILDGYADAVISPVPSVGLIFTTGRRSTLAHTLAMVPSMGGKMALPGIPELKWSDFPVGNIDSLSKNIVGENKYRAKDGLGNKEYTTTDGTSIIPARNPEAGFSGVFASRYAGSQLTQMFLTEDGLFPSEALTDAVLKTDIFAGNIYQPGTGTRGTYTKNFVFHGTGEDGFKNLGLVESIFDDDIIRKTSQTDTVPGVAQLISFYNTAQGPTIESGNGLIAGVGRSVNYSFHDYVYKTDVFAGDLYNKENPYSKGLVFHGTDEKGFKNFGLVESIFDTDIIRKTSQNETSPGVKKNTLFYNVGMGPTIQSGDGHIEGLGSTLKYPGGDYIYKTGIFQGDLYKKDSEYFPEHSSNVPVDKPLYLGHAGTGGVNVHTTQIYGKNDIPPGTAKERTTDFDHESDGKESKVFTISTHSGKNFYKKGTLYLSGHGTLTPTGKLADDQAGFSIGKRVGDSTFTTKVTAYSETNKEPISISDGTFPNFSGDLYDKDNKYRSQISSFGIVSSPPTLTRLRTHADTGDPTVTIKTSHPESDPNVPRLSAEGKYKNGLEDIKLQDFPLINLTGDGNLGGERQSLGFVNREITGLQGNLFGIPNTTRHGFGVLDNKKYTEIIESPDGFGGKGTLQDNKDSEEYGKGLPFVSKTLAYEHKFAPDGVKDILEPNVNPDFKTIKTPKNLGTSFSENILDKYKTLAYGDIPTSDKQEEMYSRKSQLSEKGGQYPGQDKDLPDSPGVYKIYDDNFIGLHKDNTEGKYRYGTGTGIGKPDFVNMTKYGEDGGDKVHGGPNFYPDDYIKFKFFDIVNKKNIIFRAFLSGISETFSPEWSSEKYIGRPDSVHVYQGVERSMSFEFMIAPSSKQELPILWEKLNYLVGFTYPSWKPMGSSGNRMEAPFMNLTLGDMYNAVPGYLSSLSITVDDNSPWETRPGIQLPHAINVSCEFTHIGQHALASQGTHYDFGGKDKTWLKKYDVETGKIADERPNAWDGTSLFL